MNLSQRLARLGPVKATVDQEYKTTLGNTHTANTQVGNTGGAYLCVHGLKFF